MTASQQRTLCDRVDASRAASEGRRPGQAPDGVEVTVAATVSDTDAVPCRHEVTFPILDVEVNMGRWKR